MPTFEDRCFAVVEQVIAFVVMVAGVVAPGILAAIHLGVRP